MAGRGDGRAQLMGARVRLDSGRSTQCYCTTKYLQYLQRYLKQALI